VHEIVYLLKMANDREPRRERPLQDHDHHKREHELPTLPTPSASYRRRAWIEFQRALDPLAPIKPLPPPRQ